MKRLIFAFLALSFFVLQAPTRAQQSSGAAVAKPSRMSNSFALWAQTAEKVGATTKRLEKSAAIVEYFATLSDDDLVLASRFYSNHLFPPRDELVANIGNAALLGAISEASGVELDTLRAQLVKLGDAGDVALATFQASPQTLKEPHWNLPALAQFFRSIATTSGSLAKKKLLVATLQKSSALEAKYIVKLLQGDLRIGLKEAQVEEAIAKSAGVPTAKIQRVNMLLGDIGQTAILARRNQLETAQMQLFHPLRFMLASPTNDLSDVARQMPDKFHVEDKFDGIRGQAHIQREGGKIRVALYSRTLDSITPSFPDLLEPLGKLLSASTSNEANGLILDGEIVPIDPKSGKIVGFQTLQQRLNRKVVTPEMLAQIPVAFVAYDVLFAGQKLLFEEPFSQRRQVLAALKFDNNRTRLATSKLFSGIEKLDEEFDAARARGNEGLIVKDPRATYKPGRRGKEWLKIKKALATLDVVVTAAEVGSGRRAKELSDYTFAVRASENDATLLNIGKAYSGLTDAEVTKLSQWFREHTLQEFAHGKVRTVEPKIVLEITFDAVQPSARHKSGFALRFPRIVRIRDDKPVDEIDTLETVKKLAK